MSRAAGIIDQVEKTPKNVRLTKLELMPLNFSRRIPELDGLRGLAIGMVVFVHYVWFAIVVRPPALLGYVHTMARPLWSAVDLFFVLSGFLIGGNLLDARNSPNYFSTFYIRRFCRVLPIYYLFLGLAAIAYVLVYRPIGKPLDWVFAGKLPLPWYSYLSFAQNLWMAKLDTIGATILAITWAFAVEVQFYFVVPAIIRFIRRSALPYVFGAGIVIAPLMRLFILFRFRANLMASYVLLPCRMDALFLGLLCAYCVREPKLWCWLVKHRNSLWMVVFALLAGIPALNQEGIPFTLSWASIGYGWMSLFYTTVLILCLTDSRSFLSRAIGWRWLACFGRISYGVYLFHLGIYGLFMWRLTDHGWLLESWRDFGVIVLASATTIAFASLSWRYFEKPIVRWSHTWRY